MNPMKLVVLNGDQAMFLPQFGVATLIVSPVPISGTGQFLVNGKKACVSGDESNVTANAKYMTAAFPTQGSGTVKIEALAQDQTVPNVKSTKPVIVKGTQFDATFSVTVPAMLPGNPPQKDETKSYSGKGEFQTTQSFVFAG